MVLVKLTDFFTTVIWLALDFYYDRNFTRQHNRQLSLLPHFAILCTRSTWGKFMRLKVEASLLSGRPPSCASAGASEGQESGSLQESHFTKVTSGRANVVWTWKRHGIPNVCVLVPQALAEVDAAVVALLNISI